MRLEQHEEAIVAVLDASSRRALIRHALQGGAVAALVMTPILVMTRGGLAIAMSALAAALVVLSIWWRRAARTRLAIAAALELRYPHLQNIAVTAEELIRHRGRGPEWIRARVFADAGTALQRIDAGAAWPIAPLASTAAIALTTALAVIFLVPPRALRPDGSKALPTSANAKASIDVVLTPPSYTRQPVVRLHNPDRLESLEGTAARVTVTNGTEVRIRLGARPLTVTGGNTEATADAILSESNYLAIESRDATGAAVSRLIPITVVPDVRPIVRIAQPAHDLLLPDARTPVAITVSGTDDIGLTALALRYTKVSGEGEEFDFVEGELPLQIARDDDRHWRGRGSLPLKTLGLEPGDSLVYRVTGRDARPGDAGEGSSETFFVEIAGPGQVPLEGIEMPPEQERYALSQQMVVVKIKRLRERERQLAVAALEEQTSAIAAEQRSVRANFIFLMGGHVEDEEEEAEQSNEIQEGRLENTSRREMSRAVSHMTAAEQGLTARDTAAALRSATLAVEALQRAFSRNRYILRTLASRTRLDPSRRLTGARDDAASTERDLAAAAADPETKRARELLVGFLDLVAQDTAARASARSLSQLAEIAEAALAVKPGDRGWRETSEAVIRVRDLITANADAVRVADQVGDTVRRLTLHARRDLPSLRRGTNEVERLQSALSAEGRRR